MAPEYPKMVEKWLRSGAAVFSDLVQPLCSRAKPGGIDGGKEFQTGCVHPFARIGL